MRTKKTEFYCNLGRFVGYVQTKPELRMVRAPTGERKPLCQFLLSIPGKPGLYTVFLLRKTGRGMCKSGNSR